MAKDRDTTLRPPHPGDAGATVGREGNLIIGRRMGFAEHTCCTCGVKYAIEHVYDLYLRRGDEDDDAEYEPRDIYCPNGHVNCFPEPPEQERTPKAQLERSVRKLKHETGKLRREVGQLKHDLEVSEAETSTARAECELLYAVAVDVCPDKSVFTDELTRRRNHGSEQDLPREPAPSSQRGDAAGRTKAKPKPKRNGKGA